MTDRHPPEQHQMLARQLRLVETLAWEHEADPDEVHDELDRAYRANSPEALALMAATASSRIGRLVRQPSTPLTPSDPLPRDLFYSRATIDDHQLVEACLELVERSSHEEPLDPLVHTLVAVGRGRSALVELLSIAMTASHLLVKASSDYDHPRELLSQEAARTERAWAWPDRP